MSDEKQGVAIRLRNGTDIYIYSKPIGLKGFDMDALLEDWDENLEKGVGLRAMSELLEKIIREALSWQYEQDQIDDIFKKGLLSWDCQKDVINALIGGPKNASTPASSKNTGV